MDINIKASTNIKVDGMYGHVIKDHEDYITVILSKDNVILNVDRRDVECVDVCPWCNGSVEKISWRDAIGTVDTKMELGVLNVFECPHCKKKFNDLLGKEED